MSCVILVTGLLDMMPLLLAIALAVGLAVAVHGGGLLRHALRVHRREHTFTQCRGAGFLALGVLTSGATVIATVASTGGVGPASTICATGFTVSTAVLLVGLLLLPGTSPGLALARTLDGLTAGACLLFAAWLLIIAPFGPDTGHRILIVLVVTGAAAPVTIVLGAAGARHRPAAVLCSGGALLSILGLAGFADATRGVAAGPLTAIDAVLIVFGPMLMLAGARRDAPVPAARPRTTPSGPISFPVLAVPAAAAVGAAGYELMGGPGFDPVTVGLGLAILVLLSARQALAVRELRRYAATVTRQATHFRALVAGSTDVIMLIADDATVTWLSPAANVQFGLGDADVVGRHFTDLLHPDDVPAAKAGLEAARRPRPATPELIEARLRDGLECWRETESTISDLRDIPEVRALVVHLRDVGERRELERALHRLGTLDPTTGLSDEAQLTREVEHRLARLRRIGSVLAIDLDARRALRTDPDAHDLVIAEAAGRIRTTVSQGECVARLADNTFAVVSAAGPVQTADLADRLVATLSEPYAVSDMPTLLHVTVGIAEFADADNAGELLTNARLARQSARWHQTDVEWYDESLTALAHRRELIGAELPDALRHGELELLYRPVLDLLHGRPAGAQASLRWRHPSLGVLDGSEIVPVAEDVGSLDALGEWVLDRTCRQLCAWQRDSLDLWISISLEGPYLYDPRLVGTIRSVLGNYGTRPELLVLEVSESSVALEPAAAIDQLAALRAVGTRTALAGFGTGLSSLGLLRRLPIDLVRVADGANAPHSTGALTTVAGLARRLGIDVIADGLAVQAAAEPARAAGSRYGQGPLFGAARPAEHFEAYVSEYRLPQ